MLYFKIPKDDLLNIVYLTSINYVIPLIRIIFIYFRVSLYAHNQSVSDKQLLFINNNRDFLILRGTIILVISFSLLINNLHYKLLSDSSVYYCKILTYE
jgi:hypothetical protein